MLTMKHLKINMTHLKICICDLPKVDKDSPEVDNLDILVLVLLGEGWELVGFNQMQAKKENNKEKFV